MTAMPSNNLPLPKYHQIYLVLREQLQEGRFADGLPGEFALMQQFSVARVTVRRALELLEGEGMISREPGRGTRPLLSAPTLAAGMGADGESSRAHLTGLLENLVSMGLRTSVKVLDVDTVTASRAVAGALQIAVGDSVQKAVRVRSTKEGPLSTSLPMCLPTLRANLDAASWRENPSWCCWKSPASRSAGPTRPFRRSWPMPWWRAISTYRWAQRCWQCAASFMTIRSAQCSGCTGCIALTATNTKCSCPVWAASTPRSGSAKSCLPNSIDSLSRPYLQPTPSLPGECP